MFRSICFAEGGFEWGFARWCTQSILTRANELLSETVRNWDSDTVALLRSSVVGAFLPCVLVHLAFTAKGNTAFFLTLLPLVQKIRPLLIEAYFFASEGEMDVRDQTEHEVHGQNAPEATDAASAPASGEWLKKLIELVIFVSARFASVLIRSEDLSLSETIPEEHDFFAQLVWPSFYHSLLLSAHIKQREEEASKWGGSDAHGPSPDSAFLDLCHKRGIENHSWCPHCGVDACFRCCLRKECDYRKLAIVFSTTQFDSFQCASQCDLFLQAVIQNEGQGRLFLENLPQQAHSTRATHVGPELDRCFRLFFACCLHHCHLSFESLRSAGTSKEISGLLNTIYLESENIKRYLGQMRVQLQQAVGAPNEAGEEEEKNGVDESLEFHQRIAPGIQSVSNEEFASDQVIGPFMERGFFLLKLSPLKLSLRRGGGGDGVGRYILSEDIPAFLKSVFKTSSLNLEQCINVALHRAAGCVARIEGFQLMRKLLVDSRPFLDSQCYVLRHFASSLRDPTTFEPKYYLHNLATAPSLVQKCRDSFFELIQSVIQLFGVKKAERESIRDGPSHSATLVQLAALDCCAIRLSDDDFPLFPFKEIFRVLEGILNERGAAEIGMHSVVPPEEETPVRPCALPEGAAGTDPCDVSAESSPPDSLGGEEVDARKQFAALKLFRCLLENVCTSSDLERTVGERSGIAAFFRILVVSFERLLSSPNANKTDGANCETLDPLGSQRVVSSMVCLSSYYPSLTVPREVPGGEVIQLVESIGGSMSQSRGTGEEERRYRVVRTIRTADRSYEIGRRIQFVCDGCGNTFLMTKVLRYRCMRCSDFDFCCRCYSITSHTHTDFVLFQLEGVPPPCLPPNESVPLALEGGERRVHM